MATVAALRRSSSAPSRPSAARTEPRLPGAVAPGVPAAWAVTMFVGQGVALSFPLVALRHRTGAIWPVLTLHGTYNAVLYTVAEPATVGGPAAGWLLGEGGLITTAGAVAAVLVTRPLWRP